MTRLEVRGSRPRLLAIVVALVLPSGLWMAAAFDRPGIARWLGLAFALMFAIQVVKPLRWLLARGPALVLDEHGLHDHVGGQRAPWQHVDAVECFHVLGLPLLVLQGPSLRGLAGPAAQLLRMGLPRLGSAPVVVVQAVLLDMPSATLLGHVQEIWKLQRASLGGYRGDP